MSLFLVFEEKATSFFILVSYLHLEQEGGVSDEDLMVQTVRAEIYDRTPLIAVHGGSFGSLQETAIRNVRKRPSSFKAKLKPPQRISLSFVCET